METWGISAPPCRTWVPGTALATEIILTAALLLVILGTAAAGPRLVGHNSALAVGATIALLGLFASPVSGASMNPARSLGPALIGGNIGTYWIHLVGPLCGALIALALATAFYGRPAATNKPRPMRCPSHRVTTRENRGRAGQAAERSALAFGLLAALLKERANCAG